MIEAVRAYLDLLQEDATSNDRLRALARVLDQLAMAYHQVADGVPAGEYPNVYRRGDYAAMRKLVARAFPDFGFYPSVSSGDDVRAEGVLTTVAVGDAVDDLTDIALEMQEVAWRWENTGVDDAAWHFQFGYGSHWGRHLHDVRNYVHARLFES
jgi:hypothetical protein